MKEHISYIIKLGAYGYLGNPNFKLMQAKWQKHYQFIQNTKMYKRTNYNPQTDIEIDPQTGEELPQTEAEGEANDPNLS